MDFYSGSWWKKKVNIYKERVFCAADDLTLKNEFEPEPKMGNDCPRDAGVGNEYVAQKTKRGWRTRGYAIFSDLSEKNR